MKQVTVTIALVWAVSIVGCDHTSEAQALALCREGTALETSDLAAAMQIKRRVWEQMPYTGTLASKECARDIRERMGRVRALVSLDEHGDRATIEGCRWAVGVVEAFDDCSKPPFRMHWARRLMERCVAVVGRAWTRTPDSADFIELNKRIKTMAESKSDGNKL